MTKKSAVAIANNDDDDDDVANVRSHGCDVAGAHVQPGYSCVEQSVDQATYSSQATHSAAATASQNAAAELNGPITADGMSSACCLVALHVYSI